MYYELPNYDHYIHMVDYALSDYEIIEWICKFKDEHERNIRMYADDVSAVAYLSSEYHHILMLYKKYYKSYSDKIRLFLEIYL